MTERVIKYKPLLTRILIMTGLRIPGIRLQLALLVNLPTWALTTPTESTCQEQNGGVVCTFTDNSGSVTLTPTGVANPNLHYVFTDTYCEGAYQKYCSPTTTHSGTYWFPRL